MDPVSITEIPDLELIERRGALDIYKISSDRLLLLSTDRLYLKNQQVSQPIPSKGIITNKVSVYWFKKLSPFVHTFYLGNDRDSLPEFLHRFRHLLNFRVIFAKPIKSIPIQCNVISTIEDTAWDEFQKTGTIAGIPVPEGLLKGNPLPFPLFAPKLTTSLNKTSGYASFEELKEFAGPDIAQFLQDKSIEIYLFASRIFQQKGINLLSCSFEYGLSDDTILLASFPFTPETATFSLRKSLNPLDSESFLDNRIALEELNEDAEPIESDKPIHLQQVTLSRISHAYDQYFNLLTKDEPRTIWR